MIDKKPKMIYVKWIDNYSHKDGWGLADYSKSIEGIECETVGFLMQESKKCFHIALNFCYKEDGSESADSTAILKSCVIKKRFLK